MYFKYIYTKTLKVFFVYQTVEIICLSVSLFTLNYMAWNNYLLSVRIFLMLEFILISFLYLSIFQNKKVRSILLGSILFFEIFCAYDYLSSPKAQFDFIPLVIECFFFTTIILYFFYNTMRNNYKTPLYELPTFWISVGFLFYFSGNFFLFLFSKITVPSPDFREQYILIYSFMTITKNLLLCTAIIANKNLFNKKETTLRLTNLEFEKMPPL